MVTRKALVAILAFAAVPAQAQSLETASRRLDLAGTAPAACVISQATATRAVNASYSPTGINSGQIAIAQLVDSQSARSLESSIQLELPVTCNSSHHVVVRSSNGGLVRTGATSTAINPTGFSEAMNYQLGIDWHGDSRILASNDVTTSIDTAEPAKGDLTLNFSTSAGNGPLVAGQYTDSIVVEFIPAN